MARVLVSYPPHARGPVLDIMLSEFSLVTLLTRLCLPGAVAWLESTDVPEGFAFARWRAGPDEAHYGTSPIRADAPAGPATRGL